MASLAISADVVDDEEEEESEVNNDAPRIGHDRQQIREPDEEDAVESSEVNESTLANENAGTVGDVEAESVSVLNGIVREVVNDDDDQHDENDEEDEEEETNQQQTTTETEEPQENIGSAPPSPTTPEPELSRMSDGGGEGDSDRDVPNLNMEVDGTNEELAELDEPSTSVVQPEDPDQTQPDLTMQEPHVEQAPVARLQLRGRPRRPRKARNKPVVPVIMSSEEDDEEIEPEREPELPLPCLDLAIATVMPQLTKQESSMKVRRKHRKYTVEEKLALVERAMKGESLRSIESATGVNRKCLRQWRRDQDKLRQMNKQSSRYRTSGGGRAPKFPEVEKKVLEWIKDKEEANLPVTYWSIRDVALQVADETGDAIKGFKASVGWLEKFIKRHQIKCYASTPLNKSILCKNREDERDEMDNEDEQPVHRRLSLPPPSKVSTKNWYLEKHLQRLHARAGTSNERTAVTSSASVASSALTVNRRAVADLSAHATAYAQAAPSFAMSSFDMMPGAAVDARNATGGFNLAPCLPNVNAADATSWYLQMGFQRLQSDLPNFASPSSAAAAVSSMAASVTSSVPTSGHVPQLHLPPTVGHQHGHVGSHHGITAIAVETHNPDFQQRFHQNSFPH